MKRTRQLRLFIVMAALVGGHAEMAFAVSRCGVGRLRDGTLTVRATGVTGTLRWGGQLGEETQAFYNAATCLSGTARAACVLGAPGTPERVTPPATCTMFLADDGPARCSAYVRKCLPAPLPIPCPLFPRTTFGMPIFRHCRSTPTRMRTWPVLVPARRCTQTSAPDYTTANRLVFPILSCRQFSRSCRSRSCMRTRAILVRIRSRRLRRSKVVPLLAVVSAIGTC